MSNRLPAIHPGEILREEFMLPLELSANRLAQSLGVAANRITSITNGTRKVTADTAMRLAAYFDTTPQFWLNLQTHYALEIAMAEKGSKIQKQVAKHLTKPRPQKRASTTRRTAKKRTTGESAAKAAKSDEKTR